MIELSAKIHKLGINPCVDVPERIVKSLLREAGRKSAPVQVKVAINGKGSFETSVVKYRGAYRLYLNTRMRKDAGVDVGDTVRISLEYDPVQRMQPMPEAFKEALNQNRRAKEKWHLQTSSRRKETLAYLNSLKNEESVKRNVTKIIHVLLENSARASPSDSPSNRNRAGIEQK